MLKILEPLEKLTLNKYACNKYWIDEQYRSCRIIVKFTRQDDGWLCERNEYRQEDVCNRRDKGECLKSQKGIMDEERALKIINDFIEHTTLGIAFEYVVWGYDYVPNKEYNDKAHNTRRN